MLAIGTCLGACQLFLAPRSCCRHVTPKVQLQNLGPAQRFALLFTCHSFPESSFSSAHLEWTRVGARGHAGYGDIAENQTLGQAVGRVPSAAVNLVEGVVGEALHSQPCPSSAFRQWVGWARSGREGPDQSELWTKVS